MSSAYFLRGKTIGDVFARLLTKWIPPPAGVLDPTCGQRTMYKEIMGENLDKSADGGYRFTFTDIREDVSPDIVLDARDLLSTFKPKSFRGLVCDPPYRRHLEGEEKEFIKQYVGGRDFPLATFIESTVDPFADVLEDGGSFIFKVGNNHRDGILEDWDAFASNVYGKRFLLLDKVCVQPMWTAKWAPKTKYSIQRSSYFLWFKKR